MSRLTQVVPENQAKNTDELIRRSRDRVWEHRMVWLLLLTILGLTGYFFVMGQVDDKLTKEILKRLRTEFPGHQVNVDRAHLQHGQSITIEGIRITKPTEQGLRDVVRCGRLVCHGPLELIGLAQGQLPVQKVVADGLEVWLWPMSDGRFSVQELSSKKPLNASFPAIEVRSGLLRIGNESAQTGQEIICHDLRVQANLLPRMIAGRVMPLAVKVTASVSSSFFRSVNLVATINEDKTNWTLQGQIAKFEYSQRLADQLPRMFQKQLSQVEGFSGQFNTSFAAVSNQGTLEFEAKSTISQGRLLHPKVPYPLESISGEVHFKKGSVYLNHFKAFSRDTSLAFAGHVHGYSFPAPLEASFAVQGLALDERLYQALPVSIQETWRRMGVAGKVNAQATLQFDGSQWKPRVTVQALNAGLEPEFFPYPVKNVNGEFVYENGVITAKDLVGQAGEQTIRGGLTLTQAKPRWLMDLRLAADGPIAIDEALLKALSPRGTTPSGVNQFVTSLHPSGTVLLKQGRFTRTADRPDTISKAIELTFSECSIKYDNFRYPIVDVHGEVTIDNERILLRDFVGRNDGARIKGYGLCQTKNAALESLELFFDGFDVGLDEELQLALPKSVRGLWDQLQPSGVLDQVNVEITRKSTSPAIDYRVEVVEKSESETRSGRSVSVRPISLPYQINDIACKILYRPGKIDIKSLSGTHDSSRMKTEGMCRLHSDGTWDGMLYWLPSTRLVVDQSLLNCLPSYLRDPLVRMDFRGPVSITGNTRVSSPTTPYQPQMIASTTNSDEPMGDVSIVREWDLELQIEDGRLGGGGIASGIRGSLSLLGMSTPAGPMAYGMLDLDALAIKNVAVTGVRGPFAFNREQLMFGRDAIQWQQKQNLQVPSLRLSIPESEVVAADYLGQNQDSNAVSQASFRSEFRDSLANRPGILNRSEPVPPENPNAVSANPEVPILDIKDTDVRARSLSGTIFLSGTEPLGLGERARYRFRLVDADLHGFLVDLGETNTSTSGRLSVQCDVNGALTNTSSLEGQGQAWLRRANLYELPAMIRLFQILSVSPSQAAFDSADVQFAIDGDQFPIQELTLDGDIVSMRGTGWVNMRREVHLDMFANVGRRGGIFRPISNASGAKLWRIEVDGTTNDPQIRHHRLFMNTLDKVLPENASRE
jgi:hypothetical protein